MGSTAKAAIATILILIIALSANYIVARYTEGVGVIDLTSNKRYTLAEGTKKVLANVQRPLKIKLYYSKEAVTRVGYKDLASFNNHYFFVRDLVKAFERASGGSVIVEEHDPRPWSDAALEADSYGIQGFPLSRRTDEMFYFGMALTSDTGAREVVEMFDPRRRGFVEYQIAQMVDRVSNRQKTKLGVLSSLDIAGENLTPQMKRMREVLNQPIRRAWTFIEELKQSRYEIERIDPTAEEIPADVGFLMVVHPKNLDDKALFAIDQFVMRGGKALIFTDPYCFSDQPPPNPRNPFAGMSHPHNSDCNRLLEAWGVRMTPGKYAGDRSLAQLVSTRGGAMSFIGAMSLDAKHECLNHDEIVTQGLQEISLLFPGALTKVDGRETKVTWLLQTSAEGNTWEATTFDIAGPGGVNIEKLNGKFKPGSSAVMIGALLRGKFKSAFPNGLSGEENGKEDPAKTTSKPVGPPKSLTESKDGASVLVVADVDFLSDSMAYERSLIGMMAKNNNSAFVVNALEFLSGSSDLISLRSRGNFSRPLDRIVAIRKKAEEKGQEERERIEKKIQEYEDELRGLQDKATDKNFGKVQSEALKTQKETRAELASLRKQMRGLKKDEREAIEGIKTFTKATTIFGIPSLLILVGIFLWFLRYQKKKETVLGGAS